MFLETALYISEPLYETVALYTLDAKFNPMEAVPLASVDLA